ncbi:Dephospho-CoA kinase [Phycisphaerae bacterium RAS1]|nr:Dephospho-CoA kinase [Phycisphaerae bacterium RAS1]
MGKMPVPPQKTRSQRFRPVRISQTPVRSTKPIIGICGGIGSGKSAVSAELERLGCCVISSDRLNNEVLAEPEVLAQLKAWWGERVVRPAEGRAVAGAGPAAGAVPDRRRIAEIVFSDATQKQRLENLTHPLIARRRASIISAVEQNPAVKAIVLDSPLLFESNLDRLCNAIIFVQTAEARRLHRLQQSRNWNEQEVRRREHWQLPLEEKRRRSGYLIDNDGSPDQLHTQVSTILDEIVARHVARSE